LKVDFETICCHRQEQLHDIDTVVLLFCAQVFTGNNDNSTLKINDLWQSISARYIRLLPTDWHGSAGCMRADLVGCLDNLDS